jgi:hypothetical protein
MKLLRENVTKVRGNESKIPQPLGFLVCIATSDGAVCSSSQASTNTNKFLAQQKIVKLVSQSQFTQPANRNLPTVGG